MKTTIAIATHQRLLCESIGFIAENKNYDVICLEQEGKRAFQKIKCQQPDIALVDLDLPQMGGIEILQAIRQEASQTRFIFFITQPDTRKVSQAFKVFPHGFLHINGSMIEMMYCINAVREGKPYFSDKVYEICQDSNLREQVFSEQVGLLSRREKEILREVAKDFSTKEIAEKLFISEKTVENHKTRIGEKLNLKGQKVLKRFAQSISEWL
ncbi:MAG: LuxR C-terminal-related transcriptional regulator [Emticicia sp.]|uniref:LuxR C-terminal-related transcriptional regulator n=1 Tax=Emticicia sp. TaxID=1930953 RepID=UPI003BA71B89